MPSRTSPTCTSAAAARVERAMHQHPLPLTDDDFFEGMMTLLGWPGSRELGAGVELLSRIRGLCDGVLHGHRHLPGEAQLWPHDARPVRLAFRAFRNARAPACWVPLPGGDALAARPIA